MRESEESVIQPIHLEAPGDFLSELLGVAEASVLSLRKAEVRELSAGRSVWRVLSPLQGGLRITAGEQSLPLLSGQAAVFEGQEELSLLSAEDSRLGLLSLHGLAADRVFLSCREQGGLFFERGGAAVQRVLRVLSARAGLVSAREASELAYGMLMSLYGTGSPGPAGQRALPQVVEAALGIIRRDYAFLEGIAELAVRLEVSQEYLTRVRIENAKLLLRQGQHSIQFVSDACGFANANYFARVFRSSVGMNPRDYARMRAPASEQDSQEDRMYVL